MTFDRGLLWGHAGHPAPAEAELSTHVLRHTFVTGLVRAGNDLVLVAELAGHRRLETTRRYSPPSKADRQKAVSDLDVDV